MESDDDAVGSPPDSLSSIPTPNGTAAGPGAVTIAAAPHQQHLTLALPIQRPTPSSSSREDCWSEGGTSALIDAWGDRFLDLSRGNLKQKHWQEVADAVSSRDDYTKPPKSDVQCKNRIDTLKKKYKQEKSRISNSPGYQSTWPFFDRLDLLLGPIHKPKPAAKRTAPPLPPAQAPQKQKFEEEDEDKGEASESVPPAMRGKGWGLREVARAVAKLGEVYERVERGRMEMEEEMERRKMAFAKEVEAQRMQFFMKAQMEIMSFGGRGRRKWGEEGGGNGKRMRNGGSSSNNSHHYAKRNPNNGSSQEEEE